MRVKIPYRLNILVLQDKFWNKLNFKKMLLAILTDDHDHPG